MAFVPCAWFSPSPAPTVTTNEPGGVDGSVRATTNCYGMVPDHAAVIGLVQYQHSGTGNISMRCELSGELFPISRLRRQYDGKLVGDVYEQRQPRTWPLVGGS